MFERGESLRMWIVLAVIWTIVVAIGGWINVPRARHVPHNPEFLNRLSHEAALILTGSESNAEASRWGPLIWSNARISALMPNGARLTFPSTTTNEGVAIVRNEYSKLLEAEAGAQRRTFALEVLLTWLLAFPIMLVLRLAAEVICRIYQTAVQQGTPESAVAGWRKMREVTRPLRVDNAPGYDSGWKWGVAGRRAEHGF